MSQQLLLGNMMADNSCSCCTLWVVLQDLRKQLVELEVVKLVLPKISYDKGGLNLGPYATCWRMEVLVCSHNP